MMCRREVESGSKGRGNIIVGVSHGWKKVIHLLRNYDDDVTDGGFPFWASLNFPCMEWFLSERRTNN